MKVYCVITTKNRFELFTKAFNSVQEQTKKPYQIIVISDSDIYGPPEIICDT